jgi:hypothetical protein
MGGAPSTGGRSNGGSAGSGGSSAGGSDPGSDAAVCSYYAPNGACPGNLRCRCCMTLGAHQCTCSTSCASDAECTDPAKRACVEKAFGFCAPAADFCVAR